MKELSLSLVWIARGRDERGNDLLACKLALITSFVVPLLFGIPLPFAPIQIILLELFMDAAASSSFVAEPMEADVMNQKPRNPEEKLMNKPMIVSIVEGAVSLAIAVLVVYLYSWYTTENVTYSKR